MTREEGLAWAAGFIDGEGSFNNSKSAHPILDVSQAGVDGPPEVLQKLVEILEVGVVRGPYGPYKNQNRKPIYRYEVAGARVEHVFTLLRPWLGRIKVEQAERVLSRWSEHRNRQGRYWAKRTHCKNGHEYTPDNTRLLGNGARRCKTCQGQWNSARSKKGAS